MTAVPSSLIVPCCKPVQQCAHPNSCSRLQALAATCRTWAWVPPRGTTTLTMLLQALKLPQTWALLMFHLTVST